MNKLLFREIVEITPAKAAEYLQSNNFKSQRNMAKDHVDYLARKIEGGQFLDADIVFSVQNGTKVLMNGQHQLNAIIKTGKTVAGIVRRFKSDTVLDQSELYRQFDAERARNISDMAKVEADALGLDWARRVRSLVVAAIGRLHKGIYHRSDKVAMLHQYQDEGEFVNSIIGDHPTANRHLYRAPVAAAMFKTWRKSQRDAKEFWASVSTGENLALDHPAYPLREWLLRVHTYDNRMGPGNKEIIDRCFIAWNAFRNRKKMKSLRYNPAKNYAPK